ncbi:MAG: response regulator transcription factor [Clostridia bacterium]|nr:response regulator transcription factor [Clostridia bacterium]
MKILILDDEPAINGFVEINMKRAGFETFTAASGEEALEIFAKNRDMDIALLDVMLPGIDGFEVCRRLREESSGMGIIMLSAKTQETDKVTGLMIGADDYVPKPFSITELMARVESLRRRLSGGRKAENDSADRLASGEYCLLLRTRQLFRGDKEIILTQTEFQVLKYFFENKNRAIAREEILEGVWGSEFFGDDKIVDVNVRRLRLKVEDDPADPIHLIALRGFGYKWAD